MKSRLSKRNRLEVEREAQKRRESEKKLIKRFRQGDLNAGLKLLFGFYGILRTFTRAMVGVSDCLTDPDVQLLVDETIIQFFRTVDDKWDQKEPLLRFVLSILRAQFIKLSNARRSPQKQTPVFLQEISIENLPMHALEEFPDTTLSVNEEVSLTVQQEQLRQNYRILCRVCEFTKAEEIVFKLSRGLRLKPKKIKNWDLSSLIEDFTPSDLKELKNIQRKSVAAIGMIICRAEIKMRECLARHYVTTESKRRGVTPQMLVSEITQSNQEEFVIESRLLERHDFRTIAKAFPDAFGEELSPVEVQIIYFNCLARITMMDRFAEVVRTLISKNSV
jgi:hypothetical protein